MGRGGYDISGLKPLPYATSHSELPLSSQHTYEQILLNPNYCKESELHLILATQNIAKRSWQIWQEDTRSLAGSLLSGFDWMFIAKAALFLLIDVVFHLTDDTYITTGHLEPSLRSGWTRVRSEYSCGDQTFDDFVEQRMSGIMELVRSMQRSLPDAKITVIPYRTGSTVQKYTAKVPMWLRRISSILIAALPRHNRNPTGLPHHNVSGTATTAGTTNAGNSQQHRSSVHLMCCVHSSHDDPMLRQVDIHVIKNDQALFNLLRTEIARPRNRLLRALSCRSVQEILFSKFSLRSSGSVDVRNHKESCLPIVPTIRNFSFI